MNELWLFYLSISSLSSRRLWTTSCGFWFVFIHRLFQQIIVGWQIIWVPYCKKLLFVFEWFRLPFHSEFHMYRIFFSLMLLHEILGRVETKIKSQTSQSWLAFQLRLWDLIYLHIVLERTVGSWSLYKIKHRICQRKGNYAQYFPLFTYSELL